MTDVERAVLNAALTWSNAVQRYEYLAKKHRREMIQDDSAPGVPEVVQAAQECRRCEAALIAAVTNWEEAQ